MRKKHSVWVLGMLVVALVAAWGQDSSSQNPAGGTTDNNQDQPQTQQPVPAYGQENAPPPISENPPLSGLDLPSLEPHAAPLSYIQPGATASETADSNAGNGVGSQNFISVTRAIGSVTLQRLWSHYDLAMDYFGGAAYYDEQGLGWKALQQMDIDQKITWKRGQLSVRDSFSYLPEGNFGGAYGSLGSQGIESLGTTAFSSFWGGTGLGTIGLNPRILNLSLADISENLTPKSAVTAAGGYAFTHFYGNNSLTGLPAGATFLGSSQVSAQGAYNRLLSAQTQVALVYGYQGFDFNVSGTAFHSQIIQGMYGHRITGRMDLLLAAGPQFTFIRECPNDALFGAQCVVPEESATKIGAAGRLRLRYKFPQTSVDLTAERFVTNGAGLFAGAETDLAQLLAQRPINRVWSAFANLGYSYNDRLQPNAVGGIPANLYAYAFIGAGVHRAFGHNLHGFASYQFNELTLDRLYCTTTGPNGTVGAVCNRIGNRQVITIGLDWTPRPIRID